MVVGFHIPGADGVDDLIVTGFKDREEAVQAMFERMADLMLTEAQARGCYAFEETGH